MNKVSFTGRVTNDVVYQAGQAQGQSSRAAFSIAVPRFVKDETDFFNCVAWGSQADYINRGLAEGRYVKGAEIEVSGRIQQNNYTDKNGVQRQSYQVIVESSHSKKFVPQNNAQQTSAPAPAQYGNPNPAPAQYGNYNQTPAQTAQPNYNYQYNQTPVQQAPAQPQTPVQPGYQGYQYNPAPAQQQTGGYTPQPGGYIPPTNVLPDPVE